VICLRVVLTPLANVSTTDIAFMVRKLGCSSTTRAPAESLTG
jgi:hypothetical protein